jgi:hypothetical protein
MKQKENGHSCGQVVTGNFITTMHLPILHKSCRLLFGKTSHHPGQTAPLQPRFSSLRLLAFPKAKIVVERGRFQTVKGVKENVTRQLMVIFKEDFADCFEKWKRRRNKCVLSQGEYFEGD